MRYELEVASKMNENWLFPVDSVLLRGRFTYANEVRELGDAHREIMRDAQVIPGICIAIDLEKEVIEVFDPLAETESGKLLWEQVGERINNLPRDHGNPGKFAPWTKRVLSFDKMEDVESTVKNWMYWCRRGIDDGNCEVLRTSDTWPTLREIERLPGSRMISPYDVSTNGERYTKPVLAGAK